MNNLIEDHNRNIPLKYVHWFMRRCCLKLKFPFTPFLNSAWQLSFSTNQFGLNQLFTVSVEDYYLEIRQELKSEWNFKVLFFCPFSESVWQPCFSTSKYDLAWIHVVEGHQFYQIILESDKWIQRRRILKFWHFSPFMMLQQPKSFKVLHRIYIFEQFWKRTPKVTFLLSLAEIGHVDKEMSFEA